MADILFQHGQIDVAREYVSPEIIALQGKEAVLPSLYLAQAALSAFHPDRVPVDEINAEKGGSALAQINQLITDFETDEDLRESLEKDCKVSSRNNVDILERLHRVDVAVVSAKYLVGNSVGVEPVSTNTDVEVFSGDKDVYADSGLLTFIVGPKIIELLQTSSDETKKRMLRQLRSKLSKGNFSMLSVLGAGRMNQLFDQYLESGKSSRVHGTATTIGVTQQAEPPTEAEVSLIKEENRIDSELATLINQLKPGSEYVFPGNWVRSYTGSIIIPSDKSAWPNYNRNFGQLIAQELGVFREYIAEDGIVTNEVVIDTAQRTSVETLQDLEADRSEWVKSLIALTADAVGFPEDQFVLEFGKDDKKYLEPMDFVFKVSDSGEVKVLYVRTKASVDSTNESTISFKSDDHRGSSNMTAPPAGYYMVKAGKNKSSGKYSISNTPLALIGLDTENLSPRRSKFIGTAVVASLPSSGLGEDVVFSGLAEPININSVRIVDYGASMPIQSGRALKAIKWRMLGGVNAAPFFEKPNNEHSNQMILFLDKNGNLLVINALSAHSARFV